MALVYYWNGFTIIFEEAAKTVKATICGYYVYAPERFGIVEFYKARNVLSVEGEFKNPKSNYYITSLYFYDTRVVDFAKKIKPSHRGELEITILTRMYLEDKKLNIKLLGRGFARFDTGKMDSLVEATEFVQMIEKRQSIKITTNGCIKKNRVKRFHQVSTDEVYCNLPMNRQDLFFTEEIPIHTSSPYSASKDSVDFLVHYSQRTIELPITVSKYLK